MVALKERIRLLIMVLKTIQCSKPRNSTTNNYTVNSEDEIMANGLSGVVIDGN